MLRRIPRFLRRAVLVAVVLAVSASVYQSWSSGQPGTGGWTQTQFGPLGPADRDLLIKVRLAGLWEGPTGQQAQQQAVSPAVKEIGGKLAVEHADLDQQVRDVANQLGVQLPSAPSAAQQQWMADISSRTGADYDRVFIQRVREAHGTILPAIAAVRTGTRNDLIRQFAVVADQFVSRHCEYLESSGLVNYAALPTPPSPGLLSGSTDPQDLIVPILVFVAVVLGAIGLVSALRARGSTQPVRLTVPQPQPAAAAAAPLPALAAVAAIPGPRGSPEPGRAEPVAYRESATGTYRSTSDTGPHRTTVDTGGYRAAGGTGAYRTLGDSGAYRAGAGNRAPAPVSETDTFRAITDADTFRPVTDSGGYRAVTDSDRFRAVTDSDGYRAVTDSGSHRVPSRSRSRHSSRR